MNSKKGRDRHGKPGIHYITQIFSKILLCSRKNQNMILVYIADYISLLI